MAAAVVELDALADTVRTTTKDDDLLAVGNAGFRPGGTDEGRFVGRVHVRGRRGELGGAGIDALVDRANIQRVAQFGHFLRALAAERGEAGIGEAHGLQHAQVLGILGQAVLADACLHVDDRLELGDEPRIDLARLVNICLAHAEAERLGNHTQPVRRRRADRGADGVAAIAVVVHVGDFDFVEAGEAGLKATQRLLQRFGKGAADRHDFADRLHRGGQNRRGARELLEGEARDFGDDVVDRGLEGGRRRAAGDVVVEFVQRVADGELRRDLCDREAGRLGGERRGARYARVHFDDDQTAVLRVDGKLHVRAAGLDADLAQHRDRGVAHDLVFLVGQRQRRRNGDRITGVHAHRVDVLDRADDDAVVRRVADHFHLVFLPAENRFFDQHFGGWRRVEATADDVEEFRAVIGDTATGAAEREGRADDRR
ncbi:hypothetical protein D9M68_182070 [compost metagenome]